MGTCHSINYYDDKMIGDVLDIEMFKASEWIQKEVANPDHTLPYKYEDDLYPSVEGVSNELRGENWYKMHQVHTFDFSSLLQRMSVICKSNYDDKYICFTKGSPEKIHQLCLKSAVPKNYFKVLDEFASKGMRVISLSYKYLTDFDPTELDNIVRKEIETDLIFLGFLGNLS